ncbi:MAG: wax ester/triacylglycerol synthase family O-acyltransferase [Xanthomonadales bacterium]|nr:wax ester/triacylglycerol synthase family O-acyltransferase [Gammaproteobacteria bacterium]NND56975.1 wax ester/triacylglycerol synthase family O-acyltransferase [Xanthomonadales bacterium]
MTRLNILDSSFLIAENRETPMHTGGVSLYSYPKGVDKRKFLNGLKEILLAGTDLRPMFNQRLSNNLLSKANLTFSWEQDQDFDIEYHIRHSALPRPGRYRELFALISRLHSTLLDRNRPLWEMHLIEGLAGNQFATYLKTHHCMLDGVAAMHLTDSMLSASNRGRVNQSPLSLEAWEHYKKKNLATRKAVSASSSDIKSLADKLTEQIGSGKNLAQAVMKYANVWLGGNPALNAPWHAVPRSIISSEVTGSRRFVAQSWPYQRIRAAGRALGGTLNDAVLAMCAGGLRRYLLQSGALPNKPLKAMVPISLRVEGDLESSNAVGFIVANLATHLEDPGERFTTIRESMLAGKELYSGLSAGEAELFTQIAMSPMVISKLLSLEKALPAFNLVISNVPGPKKKMYWNGARLDGIYPASIVVHGQSLNITLVSYGDQLDFGIIACRRSLPSIQRLLDCLEDTLSEMEEFAGLV